MADFDPRSSASSGSTITAIRDLTPYQNPTIRAKVIFKSPLKNWNNAKGQGKFISVDLADATGEIKCSFFNQDVDAFESFFEVGKTVEIARPVIKPGNPKFTKNKYEMSLQKTSVVKLIDQSLVQAPKAIFHLVDIDRIQDLPVNHMIDVLGVITSVGEASTIKTKKDQKDLAKRDVSIADKTKREVQVTVWGDLADNFRGTLGDVVAIKNVRVSEYRDSKQLSTIANTVITLNPDTIPQAVELGEWYRTNQGSLASEIVSISSPQKGGTGNVAPSEEISLQELVEKAQSAGDDRAVFSTVVATILWAKHDEQAIFLYKAAPEQGVNAKVIEQNGRYYCAKNGKTYDTYEARYILTFSIGDPTSSQYVSVFDDAGQVLLNTPAKVVNELKEKGDKARIDEIFEKVVGSRYVFKLRGKEEPDNRDGGFEKRLRITVSSVAPVDFVADSRKLLQKIGAYTRE